MSFGAVIDMTFLFITVSLALRGLFRGLSGEVLSLAGTLGGLYLAFARADVVAGFVRSHFDITENVAYGVGLVAVFVAVNLAAALLCRLVGAFLKATHLSLLDRLLGLGAGALKGIASLLVVYGGLLMAGPLVPPQWSEGSRSLSFAAQIWPRLIPYLHENGLAFDSIPVPAAPASPDATF